MGIILPDSLVKFFLHVCGRLKRGLGSDDKSLTKGIVRSLEFLSKIDRRWYTLEFSVASVVK